MTAVLYFSLCFIVLTVIINETAQQSPIHSSPEMKKLRKEQRAKARAAKQAKLAVEVPSATLDRIEPPPMYTFPPYKFEGIEYEDTMFHPQERFATIDPEYASDNRTISFWNEEQRRYWCHYEYIRCIRGLSYIHWVCAMKERYYASNENFVNICEMEFTNCFLDRKKFYYNGDGYKCRFVYVREHRSYWEIIRTDATR